MLWRVRRDWERIVVFLLARIELANLAIPQLHHPDYWSLSDEEDEDCPPVEDDYYYRSVKFRREAIIPRRERVIFLGTTAAQAKQVLCDLVGTFIQEGGLSMEWCRCRLAWNVDKMSYFLIRSSELLSFKWSDESCYLQVCCKNIEIRSRAVERMKLLFVGY